MAFSHSGHSGDSLASFIVKLALFIMAFIISSDDEI